MYKRWNLQRTLLTVAFAAATFAAAFALGAPITAAFGPGTSGVVTIILTTILVVVGAEIVGTVGVFTLLVGVFTAFAMPTNIFGPPGPQKIVIGLLTGAVYDACWFLFRKVRLDRIALPLAAAFATGVSIGLIYGLLRILEHPRADALGGILIYVVPVYMVLGFLGAYLGVRIFRRRLEGVAYVQALMCVGDSQTEE